MYSVDLPFAGLKTGIMEASKVANEAITFYPENDIHSAVDFKAIIEQQLKDSAPKNQKGCAYT